MRVANATVKAIGRTYNTNWLAMTGCELCKIRYCLSSIYRTSRNPLKDAINNASNVQSKSRLTINKLMTKRNRKSEESESM